MNLNTSQILRYQSLSMNLNTSQILRYQSLSMNLNTSQMILRPPTDKGIVNLEIEDMRKDSQVLEKGKGKGHTLPHHHLHQ